MSKIFTPIEVLQQAFPGIPRSEAEELVAAGKVRFYPAQTVLCREGDTASTFYIILEGQVLVSKEINFEKDRVLATLSAGDFFGEMALIHLAPRAATVTTSTPTTVLEIHKTDFDALVQRSASLMMTLAREVSRRLLENDAMAIEDLRLKAGELALAYQKLAEQDYARREFVSSAVQDLRLPLTTVDGLLQRVQEGNLRGEALNQALENINRNMDLVITGINDLLFLQELDPILRRLKRADMNGLIREAVEELSARRRPGVPVQLSLPFGSLPVDADPPSFKHALVAILDNACKFSQPGDEVAVDAESARGQVFVRVRDRGIGIAPEALSHIFDRFYRTDTASGPGMGLPLARQIVEQHGGQIFVESQPGLGTTVTICIPART